MLLKTRCLILERAGFEVWTTPKAVDAVSAIWTKEFNLFLICSSVSAQERDDLLTIAHDIQPEMKNLVMTVELRTGNFEDRDTIADGFMPPDMLLTVVRDLTHATAGRPSSGLEVFTANGTG